MTFNEGYRSKLDVNSKLNVGISKYGVKKLKQLNFIRWQKAEVAVQNITKEDRKKRELKRRLEEQEEDQDYGPGMF